MVKQIDKLKDALVNNQASLQKMSEENMKTC